MSLSALKAAEVPKLSCIWSAQMAYQHWCRPVRVRKAKFCWPAEYRPHQSKSSLSRVFREEIKAWIDHPYQARACSLPTCIRCFPKSLENRQGSCSWAQNDSRGLLQQWISHPLRSTQPNSVLSSFRLELKKCHSCQSSVRDQRAVHR